MKVKTKLQICAGVPVLLAICVTVGAFHLYDSLSGTDAAMTNAGRLVEKTLALKRAAHDLIQSPDEDAQRFFGAQLTQIEQAINDTRTEKGAERLVFEEMDGALRGIRAAQAQSASAAGPLSGESSPSAELQDDLARGTDRLIASTSMLMDLRQQAQGWARRKAGLWLIALVVLLPGLLTMTAVLTSRRLFDGITALQFGTARIAAGNLDDRVPVETNDELGELATSFNKMTADLSRTRSALEKECQANKEKAEALRIANDQVNEAMKKLQRAQTQIVQQERLLALKQISSGIMRDFNEALTPILGITEMLKTHDDLQHTPDDLEEYVSVIYDSATRATNVIKQLASFFSPHDRAPMQACNLVEIVEEALNLTRPMWKEQQEAENVKIAVAKDLRESPHVEGDRESLVEMVTNLIINAVEAMPKGGQLRLATVQQGDEVVLTIEDTGRGMDAKTSQYCFEPFYTTKDDAAGMGMTVVSGTVLRHQGEVQVESEEGVGTKVSLRFPALAPSRQEKSAPAVNPGDIPKLRILTVDDDENVSRVLARLLRVEGHTVETASSGSEGVQAYSAGKFDLVLTDRAMPDMSGDEVARRVKEISPATPVLMITGFGSSMKEKGHHPEYVDTILNKPYTQDELFAAIAQLVGEVGVCV